MAKPFPRKSYAIFFTPRSGSSWLTSLLGSVETLGTPGEVLNPEFVPAIARSYNAPDPEKYMQLTLRKRASSTGIFGLEVVHAQAARFFDDPADLWPYMPDPTWFFLIREDIVSQAVSLDKAIQTKTFHSTEASAEEIAASDLRFVYDGDKIADRIRWLAKQEVATGDLFWRMGVDPHRLSYEWMMSQPPDSVTDLFASALHEPAPAQTGTPEHRKIATVVNERFAARFRSEHPKFLATINARRAPMLARLRRPRRSPSWLSTHVRAAWATACRGWHHDLK